jgi:hypothetical protein
MDFFIENCYCWLYRKKGPEKKVSIEQTNQDQRHQLFCGGCFKYVHTLDEFTQITKIGSRYYGVCGDECYNTWLNTPAAQCLAPINDYATLSRIRDNQQ